MKNWSRNEKLNACLDFFYELADLLEGKYELVESCNADVSSYLVPTGTAEDISYYGKPKDSFRVSDHWNWYSNVKKCTAPWYIQCLSEDVPRPRPRQEEGKSTKPRFAVQVSMIGKDGKYHAVYGEKFDRYKREWTWLESTPEEVAKLVCA